MQVFGKDFGLCTGDDFFDFVGGFYLVGSASFFDVQHYHGFPELAGIGFGILGFEVYFGYIAQVGYFVFGFADDDVFYFFGRLELSDNTYVPAYATFFDISGGDGHIFVPDALFYAVKTDITGDHLVEVHGYFHFFILNTSNIGGGYLRELFDFVLQVFGEFFELLRGKITGDIDVHDGFELGEVQFHRTGVSRQVFGPVHITHGVVYLVFDVFECFVGVDIEGKFDVYTGKAGFGGGFDFIYTGDFFEFRFQRTCDEVLYIFGGVSGIGGGDENFRGGYVGKGFSRHVDV